MSARRVPTGMASPWWSIALENVGAGPDPLAIASLADRASMAAVFLQRDYHCVNCRRQVVDLTARHDAFRDRDAEVVSIVPEPADRLRSWQDRYALSFPLLADPDARVSAGLEQPVRFGVLGRFSDFLGRMPAVVLLDLSDDRPREVWRHAGSSTFDRPSIDAVLDRLDAA